MPNVPDNQMRNLLTVCAGLGMTLLLASAAPGATIKAASAGFADVTSAVNRALIGDTVMVPPGSAVWSSTVTISKGITLMGAGTNATIISAPANPILNIALAQDRPVRVTGIAFRPAADYPGIALWGRTSVGAGVPITKFRIDNCFFTGGKRAINPNGWCYGVVDHTTFLNCFISVGSTGDDDMAWSRPVQPGSANAVVIEDCSVFLNDGTITENQIYHQDGCRTILRYCKFDATAAPPDAQFMECHGNNNVGTTNPNLDMRGQVLFEIYSNRIHVTKSTYRMSHFRGGSIIMFGNSFIDDAGNMNAIQLTEEESWSTAVAGGPVRTTWPAQDQITNSFFWNNTINGNLITDVSLYAPQDATFIQQGRDYWMQAPGPANGRPAGVYANYKPLVYPHPLVSGTFNVQTNPVISITPSARDFGNVAVGSTNDVTFTIQNIGGGTLSGTANVPVGPFTIVNGGSYSLGADGSQIVTVRFKPAQTGGTNQTLSFTGGGGASAALTGKTSL